MPAPAFDTARVRFVLVRPQSAGNIGSAARALKNLGFSRLVLVDPACDPLDAEGLKMAVEARNVLRAAERHADLDLALEGATTVVGTSRRTGRQRKPHRSIDELGAELARRGTGELAVVFGPEDSGLTDRDLDRCTHLVYLPSADDYPSFNLAQAVLLVAYELRRRDWPSQKADVETPADHGGREAMFRHLERALSAIGFVHAQTVEPIMRRLRRMLGRSGLTDDDVRLLRGLARQTLWAAEQAGLPIPPGQRLADGTDEETDAGEEADGPR